MSATRTESRTRLALGLSAVAALLSACATGSMGGTEVRTGAAGDGARLAASGGPEVAATRAGMVDAELLRAGSDGSFIVHPSADSLADYASTVVVGEISSWSDGAVLYNYDERDFTAVVSIKVEGALKGSKYVQNGFIYLRFHRGGEVIDEAGNPFRNPGAPASVKSLAELREAAPPGTRVVVFADDGTYVDTVQREKPPEVRTIRPRAGVPDGAALLSPYPQGFLLNDDGQVASAIADGEPWGWIPEDVPHNSGFVHVVERLQAHLTG